MKLRLIPLQNKGGNMVKKIPYLGLFLALALVCSYIETLIPFSFGIPGIKLGLTNIIVVLMIYCVGAKEAFAVSIFRIILVGFMFGNAFSIIYSLAGGMLSFFAMYLLIRFKVLKCVSVSVIGGICHNIGQIIIATIVVENINIMWYLPVLLVAGVITGFIIGLISQEIILRIGNKVKF